MLSKKRFLGALFGLAVGDAVGTTLEFVMRDRYTHITDMVGGGPFNLEPGQWTDDTSMALCLGESLIASKGMDLSDQMDRYISWKDKGYMSSTGKCFDIGNTVLRALVKYQRDGDPVAGSTHERSAGNGSIMRLSPVPMFYANDAQNGIKACAESSLTTHGARACIDACRYFGGLILGALNGIDKETLLSSRWTPIDGEFDQRPLCVEIRKVAEGSFKEKSRDEIKGTGYVVESLEAALWCFYQSNDYEEGVLLAANLGDDADTTAAVYGQLAGAFYGVEGIPSRWIEKVAKRGDIERVALDLWEFSAIRIK